jgi:polyhydroxyalkanoate synthesis regulator protein
MAHLLKKRYNMKQLIEFRDPVVQCVVNKFVERSDIGFAKYGKTLRDDKSDLFTWLNHIQEELMDATLYIQRLKEEISDLREERDLRNSIQDLDVIDPETVTSKKKEKKRLKSGNGRGDHYTFTIDNPCGKYLSSTTNSHLNLMLSNEEDK